MVVNVGINGFGRIGRIIFRTILQTNDLEVSAINDPAVDIDYICYLIKFDSTHGRLNKVITFRGDEITVDGNKIKVFREKIPTNIPWETVDVEYVIEASGMFTNLEKASGHLVSKSVKRVILTAPSVDIPMLILGVNEDTIKIDQKVISCASSTLYCLAPLIKVLEENYGVGEGFITSIHAMTPSLKPLDGLCLRGKHWRDHRGIHQNIIPAATGACKALGKIIPRVKDKMTGLAFRVPIVNVSVLDVTIRLDKNTTLEDIVKHVENSSLKDMKNIIKISADEAVSSDFISDSNSCILDINSSLQLTPNFFKLICWYENEYSYACRVIDTIMYSEKCFSLELFFKLHNAYKFTSTFRRRPIACTEKQMYANSCYSIRANKPKIFLSSSNENYLEIELPNKEKNIKRKLGFANSQLNDQKLELTKDFHESNFEKQYEKPKLRGNVQSLFHTYLASKTCISSDDIKSTEIFEPVQKEFTNSVANQIQTTNLNNYSNDITIQEDIKFYQETIKSKTSQIRPLSGDCFYGRRNFKNVFERGSTILENKSCCNLNVRDSQEKELKVNKENININYNHCKENAVVLESENTNIEKYNGTLDTLESHNDIQENNKLNCSNGDNVTQRDLQLYGCNTYTINQVITELPQNSNIFNSKIINSTSNNLGINNRYGKINNEQSENINREIKKVLENILKLNNDVSRKSTDSKSFQNVEKTKYCANDYNKEDKRLQEENMKDTITKESIISCLFDDTSSISPVNTTGNSDKENVQDIYDKLDSESDSDSNNSFQIHERKSQIIDITDLTASIEDLARLEKICKIIEISDDLSDRLFSVLDNNRQDLKNKSWSFKDLCERLKLDEFYNNVFGQLQIRDVCEEKNRS